MNCPNCGGPLAGESTDDGYYATWKYDCTECGYSRHGGVRTWTAPETVYHMEE